MVGTETRLYRIIGHSMNPTLYENNLVLTKHQKEYTRGDIIAFRKDGRGLSDFICKTRVISSTN